MQMKCNFLFCMKTPVEVLGVTRAEDFLIKFRSGFVNIVCFQEFVN